MSVYQYSGITKQGKSVKGAIDADSPKNAKLKLRQNGVFPVDLSERSSSISSITEAKRGVFDFSRSPRSSTLLVFTKQLSILLDAGVPVLRALSLLGDQIEDPYFRGVLSEVREGIKEGKSFGDSLAAHPRTFTSLTVHMVKAGEASGELGQVLGRLGDSLERQAHLKGRLSNALIYPAFMAGIGLLILVGLVTFVIPQITSVFSEMGAALPLPTLILMGMSSFFNEYGWGLLVGFLVGMVAVYWLLLTSLGRLWRDRSLLRIPILGKILLQVALSKFSQTLGTLLRSGVSLLEGLHIAKKVLGNKVLESIMEQAAEHIREGESLADPLRRSQRIPSLFVNMVAVGEQTGDLEEMLLKVGQAYDVEVEMRLTRLMSLLEPLMVFVMGLIVLFIVLAILLPLFQMSQIIH
jgi:general secretion pathway protein F